MARINNDRPPVNGVSQTHSKATSYDPTTKKVTAAAGKVPHSQAQVKGMKEHKVTQKTGEDNVSAFAAKKRPGKETALATTAVARPAMPKLNLEKKLSSAGRRMSIPKPNEKIIAATKKVFTSKV